MTESVNKFKDWVLNQAGAGTEFALSPALRSASLDALQTGIFPTRKDEEWRYTPLKDLYTRQPDAVSTSKVDQRLLERVKGALPDAHHLVFIDGEYSTEYSDGFTIPDANKLTVKLLSDLDQKSRSKAEQTINQAKLSDDNIFQHITRSLSHSGVFIDLGDSVEIEKVLHLLFLSTDSTATTISNPISIVHIGQNSRLSIVQQFASTTDAKVITIPADYIKLEDGAGLDLYKVGLESNETDHISNSAIQVAGSATFTSHLYLLGSRLTRSNTEVSFAGVNSEVVLKGIYLGNKSQHLDIRTYVDHAHPHCLSDQHFRGIMNDQSRGVFNGLVLVREHAQKTDARQSNKNLLLSRDARIDTKPQLEIFADDVKCTHGATVGELDDNALFYLQSRGIGKSDAILMLTRAFAAEITQEIKLAGLREYIEEAIANRLNEVNKAND